MTKPYIELRKTSKHCTNYGQDNHNVETCKVKKKEEPIIATIKCTNQPLKGLKNNLCVCHIYGLHGHKMMNCPKFVEM
jgi:predicted ATPase